MSSDTASLILLDGWEAWPDHADDHDHDHEGLEPLNGELDAAREPEVVIAEKVKEPEWPAEKSKSKSSGKHDHPHHPSGREKKAKIARAH
jgi:hypothetical protein